MSIFSLILFCWSRAITIKATTAITTRPQIENIGIDCKLEPVLFSELSPNSCFNVSGVWTPEEGVPVSFGTGAASTSSVETLAGSDSTSLSDSSGDSIDSPDASFVTGGTS